MTIMNKNIGSEKEEKDRLSESID